MNFISQIIFFYRRKIEPGFTIGRSALVVDIGSGDKPFWRADVFVDKLSLGNVQRTSVHATVHDVGMFVNADVTKLPFKDNCFDFSFCSHLLEHVDDPSKAIKEIVRISKRGYLEVPNGVLESVMPFDSHLWFIYRDGDTLVFVRKSKKIHDILRANSAYFEGTLEKIREPFIRLYWEKTIKFKIIDDVKQSERYKSVLGDNKKQTVQSGNPYLALVKLLRTLFHTEKQNGFIKKTVY